MRFRASAAVATFFAATPALAARPAPPDPNGHVQQIARSDDDKTLAKDTDEDECVDRRHRLCKKDKEDTVYGFAGLGFRGATTGTSRVPAAGGTTTLQIALNVEAVDVSGISTSRFRQDLAIGGGSAGFDGLWRGIFTTGVRPEIVKGQGPMARIGFGWQLAGNDRHYASYLELPRLEVGYQIAVAPFTFEIGGRGGAILTGALHIQDEKRTMGTSLDAGGFFLLGLPGVRVEGDAFRVFSTTKPGNPIDVLNGSACIAYGLLLCGDAAYYRSDLEVGGGLVARQASATYIGVTVGVGLGGPADTFSK